MVAKVQKADETAIFCQIVRQIGAIFLLHLTFSVNYLAGTFFSPLAQPL